MEEQWKLITCLNHSDQMTAEYEASNLGRIRNKRTQKIIQPHKHNSGYQTFQYRYKDENDNNRFSVMLWHRIIAMTWIDNPDNLPQVDHIDRDMHNNAVANLRWVSAKENSNNTGPRSKIRYSRYNQTYILDREGNIIDVYPTLVDACKAYGVRIEHALEMMHGRRLSKSWGTFYQEVEQT